MKNLKIALWVIFIAFLFLVFFQNKEFMIGKQSLILNLYVFDEMQSPPLPVAVWLLAAMVIGFLISYAIALIEKFRTNRVMKALKAKMETQDQLITQLKQGMGAAPGFQSGEELATEAIDVGTPAADIRKLPPDEL